MIKSVAKIELVLCLRNCWWNVHFYRVFSSSQKQVCKPPEVDRSIVAAQTPRIQYCGSSEKSGEHSLQHEGGNCFDQFQRMRSPHEQTAAVANANKIDCQSRRRRNKHNSIDDMRSLNDWNASSRDSGHFLQNVTNI